MGSDTVLDSRTRMLLEAPIAPTLLRLAAPNVLVMLAQAGVGLIETYFVGQLGTDALAGMALVFPVVMLMQMTSAGAMGGGIASAIARALGARRRADADALVLHALVIAAVFSLIFTLAVVGGGRWLYTHMGGAGCGADLFELGVCGCLAGDLKSLFLHRQVASRVGALVDDGWYCVVHLMASTPKPIVMIATPRILLCHPALSLNKKMERTAASTMPALVYDTTSAAGN